MQLLYLLYMEATMPPNDRLPIFVNKNHIEPKDIHTKFE